MAYDPAEGPFDERPSHDPPATSSQPYWARAKDGKWYAFYGTIGPTGTFNHEHPYDSNFWSNVPHVAPEQTGSGSWTCRHGTVWVGVGQCRYGCPERPQQFEPVTDEEVEAAGRALADLLASMESNTR